MRLVFDVNFFQYFAFLWCCVHIYIHHHNKLSNIIEFVNEMVSLRSFLARKIARTWTFSSDNFYWFSIIRFTVGINFMQNPHEKCFL